MAKSIKKIYIDIDRLAGAVLRERKGAALARYLGVTRQTITNKFLGKTQLTLDELNQIAEFLDRDAIEFIEERNQAAA